MPSPITITIEGGDEYSRGKVRATLERHLIGALSRDWPGGSYVVANGSSSLAGVAGEVLAGFPEKQAVIVTTGAQAAPKDQE